MSGGTQHILKQVLTCVINGSLAENTVVMSQRKGKPMPAGKPGRRDMLKRTLGSVAASLLGGCAGTTRNASRRQPDDRISRLGFRGLAPSSQDIVRLPEGYRHEVLIAWGDPIQPDGPTFRDDASNPARDQWQQAGMHHDGMEFFCSSASCDHGYLLINHEYFDDGMLFSDGAKPVTADKVAKGKAAVGVSVLEIGRDEEGRWQILPSAVARRITAQTPMLLTGPAAGHPLLQTRDDPQGRTVYGTLANCAAGRTPWGTYLTCEENFQDFFKLPKPAQRRTAAERRYMRDAGLMCHWHHFDDRFDYAAVPREYNRFGWVVEIDPQNRRPARKCTALGRFRHENAAVTLAPSGQVVVYMGDDARFEYVYKFVSRESFDPEDHSNVAGLLDDGTLYVARFLEDGRGEWLPLVHGCGNLNEAHGFADQGEVLIHARLAAEAVGATTMDRPEWLCVDEGSGAVFVSLTNNSRRGAAGQEGSNAANRRAPNPHGHIIRWQEDKKDAAARSFTWEVFLEGGDSESEIALSSPDGLFMDQRGILWVQTDVSSSLLNKGDYAPFGNNQVVAVDAASGDMRRFLTGPCRCEVTGLTITPDGRTMFVNIQHPGEPRGGRTKKGADPAQYSRWPGTEAEAVRRGRPAGSRPRSATLVIQRTDGGVMGAP